MSKQGNYTMKITKANVQERYVVITNDFAQDNTLSLEAKGMLLLMASRPNDWVFHKSELMKECSIGRDKINRIFKELEQSGNLCIAQSFDAEGRFKSNEYVLFVDKNDNPAFIQLTEKQPPFTDLPLTDLPYTANQHLQKKDINKVNINTKLDHHLVDDGFDYFWKAYPRKEGKTKSKTKFISLTKKMNHDEFCEFVDLISKDCVKRYENTEKKFIPHGSKYMNQELWQDEL